MTKHFFMTIKFVNATQNLQLCTYSKFTDVILNSLKSCCRYGMQNPKIWELKHQLLSTSQQETHALRPK